jgi:hypothetical protein
LCYNIIIFIIIQSFNIKNIIICVLNILGIKNSIIYVMNIIIFTIIKSIIIKNIIFCVINIIIFIIMNIINKIITKLEKNYY